AANRDGLRLDAPAPTCRFARTVANATQDAGKDVRLAIDEIRLAKFTQGNQPNVFGNVGVCGTRPLTIDDTMKIIRILRIGRFHRSHRPWSKTNAVALTTCRMVNGRESLYSLRAISHTRQTVRPCVRL